MPSPAERFLCLALFPAPATGFSGNCHHAPLKFCFPDSVSNYSLMFISLILGKLSVSFCFPFSFFFIFPLLLSCPISPLAFIVLSAQGCPQSRVELVRGRGECPGIKSSLGLKENEGGLKIARILETQGIGFKFQLCQVLAGGL